MNGPLPVRQAYRLWADTYDRENAITALENEAVTHLTPPIAGRALLDAGCGTGRRLPTAGLRRAVGIDLVPELLAKGRSRPNPPTLVSGDIRALPLGDRRFDVVWCRLAIGHLRDIDRAYRELARVARPKGSVIVTDFHPDAIRAGHVRGFTDDADRPRAVEHHLHEISDHRRAARGAGLKIAVVDNLRIGPAVERFFVAAGKSSQYEAQVGLAVVLVLQFTR